MKITHSKTASRRSHHRAEGAAVVKTATGVRRKHFVDPVTGMYRGKQIISVGGKKTTVSAKKTAVKEAAAPKKKAASKKKTTTADKKAA